MALQAIYEFASDTATEPVEVEEDRGIVRFLIAPDATLPQVIEAMNVESLKLCRGSGWLHLQDGGVAVPIMRFVLEELPAGQGVQSRERLGDFEFAFDPGITLRDFIGLMNSVSEKVLEGGHLFQLWEGEVVSNASVAEPSMDGARRS